MRFFSMIYNWMQKDETAGTSYSSTSTTSHETTKKSGVEKMGESNKQETTT